MLAAPGGDGGKSIFWKIRVQTFLLEFSFFHYVFLHSKPITEQERKRGSETKEEKMKTEKTIETKLFHICH